MQSVRAIAPSPTRPKRSQETHLQGQVFLPLEAAGTMEETLAHPWDETKVSLLILVEEHDVTGPPLRRRSRFFEGAARGHS